MRYNSAHQIFIEPEGWEEPTLYVGGFSTSLPAEVQLRMLERSRAWSLAECSAPGYAVEYDMVPPIELFDTLETRRVAGLITAVSSTAPRGYEEAAAQGTRRGHQCGSLRWRGGEPLRLRRSQAYIGVLIDDLVTPRR